MAKPCTIYNYCVYGPTAASLRELTFLLSDASSCHDIHPIAPCMSVRPIWSLANLAPPHSTASCDPSPCEKHSGPWWNHWYKSVTSDNTSIKSTGLSSRSYHHTSVTDCKRFGVLYMSAREGINVNKRALKSINTGTLWETVKVNVHWERQFWATSQTLGYWVELIGYLPEIDSVASTQQLAWR